MLQTSGLQAANPVEHTERQMLIIGGLFFAANHLALALQRDVNLLFWLPLLLWIGCAIVGHRLLQTYLPQRDPLLFGIVMFLSGWGIVLIDRLEPTFADRQAMWLVIALSGMLIVGIMPQWLRWLRVYRYSILIFGLALLISTILLGENPSGFANAPQLWLGFGSLYFQPSELLKVLLISFLASYLSQQYPIMRQERQLRLRERYQWASPRIIGPTLLMWGLAVGLAIWQRDLGTAAIFFAVFLTMLYVASGRLFILLGGGLLLIIAGIVAYLAIDLVALRVDIWLNPWADAEGRAYQIVQSLMAFASGGVFGDGIGQGSPSYIPVVHSDFVFAALAEEFGLLGVIAILCSIAVLILRGMRIAVLHRERPFNALLAIGLCMLIAVQSLLIMGGVLKLVPLTGVTLPFVSYGGSSLLMSYIMIGLLLRLSTEHA